MDVSESVWTVSTVSNELWELYLLLMMSVVCRNVVVVEVGSGEVGT